MNESDDMVFVDARTPAARMQALIDEASRTIKAQAKRIDYLESHVGILAAMFGEPVSREGRYEGVKVLVITSRPESTDPLVYRAQYAEGPLTGLNLRLAHDDIEFIDPVRVVTESFVRGLLDRIQTLEGK